MTVLVGAYRLKENLQRSPQLVVAGFDTASLLLKN